MMIRCELCKRLKFAHTDKWYKHKLESVFENKMNATLRGVDIQIGQQVQARRQDRVLVNRKTAP